VVLEQVTLLIQQEAVRLDPDRLDDLFVQLGQHAAEDVVCRALEEMAARLTHVDGFHRRGELAEMRKCARSLGAIADQLGMGLLASVARDVCTCVDGGDPVAQAATLARLLRIGEISLSEIWNLRHY